MFSVPGWSLGTLASHNHREAEPNAKPKELKRKRKYNTSSTVRNETVATLWSHHVEKLNDDHDNLDNDNQSKKPNNKLRKDTISQVHDRAFDTKTAATTTPRPNQKENKRRKRTEEKKVPLEPDSNLYNDNRKMGNTVAAANREDPQSKLTPLQAAMRQKLISARFRHLNQTLYTSSSSESRALFETNPSFFGEYHAGFRQQVSTWPENPVDGYVRELKDRAKAQRQFNNKKLPAKDSWRPKSYKKPLPRIRGICTVADLGCGDGRIASELEHVRGSLGLRILSYDLQSTNPLVTKCDIASLPLGDGSIDVVIFCLALMGTNWLEFVDEAQRILQAKGELWIAEIKSRFRSWRPPKVDRPAGKRKKAGRAEIGYDQRNQQDQLLKEVDGQEGNIDQTDVSAFVKALERRGFVLQVEDGVDVSNKMFAKLRFSKTMAGFSTKDDNKRVNEQSGRSRLGVGNVQAIKRSEDEQDLHEASVLKPCLYKTR